MHDRGTFRERKREFWEFWELWESLEFLEFLEFWEREKRDKKHDRKLLEKNVTHGNPPDIWRYAKQI